MCVCVCVYALLLFVSPNQRSVVGSIFTRRKDDGRTQTYSAECSSPKNVFDCCFSVVLLVRVSVGVSQCE